MQPPMPYLRHLQLPALGRLHLHSTHVLAMLGYLLTLVQSLPRSLQQAISLFS